MEWFGRLDGFTRVPQWSVPPFWKGTSTYKTQHRRPLDRFRRLNPPPRYTFLPTWERLGYPSFTTIPSGRCRVARHDSDRIVRHIYLTPHTIELRLTLLYLEIGLQTAFERSITSLANHLHWPKCWRARLGKVVGRSRKYAAQPRGDLPSISSATEPSSRPPSDWGERNVFLVVYMYRQRKRG